jgi:hypothetical protein
MGWRSWIRFETVVCLAMGTVVVLDAINGRLWMNDFRVYWEAGDRLLHGQAVYGVSVGVSSGFFKYSPFALLLLCPFALLPYTAAALLWSAVIIGTTIPAFRMAERLLRQHVLFRPTAFRAGVLWLTFLVVGVHLHRELHMGNINMVLLAALLAALQALAARRNLAAGLWLGIAILFKPHFLALLPLLILHGRWKVLAWAGGAALIGSVVPALVLGWRTNLGLLHDWTTWMRIHNVYLFYLGNEDKEPMNTAYTVLRRLSFGTIPPTVTMALLLFATLASSLVLFDRAMARRSGAEGRDRLLLFNLLVVVAGVPSVTVTDTEHFLLAMPLIACVILHALRSDRPSWLIPVAIAVLWAFGGNWGDALGPFSDVLLDHSVLGMANLLLIGLCAFLYVRDASEPERA